MWAVLYCVVLKLWHGFARDNSEDNRWRSNEELPDGGYMDDLWVYNKRLLNPDEPMPTSSAGLGLWRNYTGKATCVDEPGATWEGRDDQNCEVEWPTARAGHTSALDAKNGGVYVFGGYTTFFPCFRPRMARDRAGAQRRSRTRRASFLS